MSKFPHLPLFTDAFIAATGHLNAQETGSYLMLLMMAWRSPDCRLPDDDAKLSRWARVDKRTWARIKPSVMEFWTLADGFWTQSRLGKEWEYVNKRADVNRRNGSQGGRAKALKNNEPANPVGSVSLSETVAPIPIPIASPEGEAASEAAKTDPRDVKAFIDRTLAEFPAFGAQAARSPLLLSAREINLWLGQGLDLVLDVDPVVREILGRRKAPPSTWGYFHAAILRHHEQRLSLPAPASGLSAGAPARSSVQNPDGSRRPMGDGVVRVRAVNLTGGGAEFYTPDDPAMVSHWRLRLRLHLKGHAWPEEDLGAPPGHPACLCPPALIERVTAQYLAESAVPSPEQPGMTAGH